MDKICFGSCAEAGTWIEAARQIRDPNRIHNSFFIVADFLPSC